MVSIPNTPRPMPAGHERPMTMIDTLAKKVLLSRLPAVQGGTLTVRTERGAARFGGAASSMAPLDADLLDAAIIVHEDRFYRRALLASDIGIGEAYMDGDWTTPDLVTLTRLMIRNLALVERKGGVVRALARLAGGLARRLRDNSITGSRRHIREHYDLGNDFFRLF